MDEFGVLTASYGLKPQGKSAPMASAKPATNFVASQTGSFGVNASLHSKSAQYGSSRSPQNPAYDYGSFLDDHNGVFRSTDNNKKTQHFGGLDDDIDIFGGPNKTSSRSNAGDGNSFGFDSTFTGLNNSVSTTSSASNNNYVDDIFGGIPDLKSSFIPAKTDHGFPAFPSPTKQHVSNIDLLDKIGSLQSKSKVSNKKGSEGLAKSVPEFDDLIPGFGGSSITSNRASTKVNKPSEQTVTSHDDPFLLFETNSTSDSSGSFLDPLEQMSKLNNSGGTRGSSNTPSLRPPPKPTNGLNINKVNSSVVSSSIDELEEFAKGQVRSNSRAHVHGSENKQHSVAKTNKSKGAPGSGKASQMKTVDDLESFFSMGSRSSSAPRSRATTLDQTFDGQMQNKRSEVPHRVPSGSAASMKKSSSTTSFDDLSLIFNSSLSSKFEEVDGEPEERRNARLGRHQRTEERAAKAVADMKQRNLQTTMEQEERRRIAETLDADIKRWAAGKEGNMRALLSSLQYVLWPECAWQPVSLTDIITSASVKKVYRKATLCIHPDKVQQKGASLEQRYTAEKVFDILKEAWKKFNAEELS